MDFKRGRLSDNVEDVRGSSGRRGGKLAGGGIGTVVLVLVAMYFGVDPNIVLQGTGGMGAVAPSGPVEPIDPT